MIVPQRRQFIVTIELSLLDGFSCEAVDGSSTKVSVPE
jgi:hypothetical protein